MKWFGNDDDGLTVVDIVAITLLPVTGIAYWKFCAIDTNYADIFIAALIASAGQKIGVNWTRRGITTKEGEGSDQPPI